MTGCDIRTGSPRLGSVGAGSLPQGQHLAPWLTMARPWHSPPPGRRSPAPASTHTWGTATGCTAVRQTKNPPNPARRASPARPCQGLMTNLGIWLALVKFSNILISSPHCRTSPGVPTVDTKRCLAEWRGLTYMNTRVRKSRDPGPREVMDWSAH